jgi:hypothetical protein
LSIDCCSRSHYYDLDSEIFCCGTEAEREKFIAGLSKSAKYYYAQIDAQMSIHIPQDDIVPSVRRWIPDLNRPVGIHSVTETYKNPPPIQLISTYLFNGLSIVALIFSIYIFLLSESKAFLPESKATAHATPIVHVAPSSEASEVNVDAISVASQENLLVISSQIVIMHGPALHFRIVPSGQMVFFPNLCILMLVMSVTLEQNSIQSKRCLKMKTNVATRIQQACLFRMSVELGTFSSSLNNNRLRPRH